MFSFPTSYPEAVRSRPEDNLDNAFIAERIARELRDAETKRQFVFSTHNANIPVFGDAEWIGIFTAEATAQRKVARSGGSLGEIQTWHFLTGQPRSFGANP